MTHLYAVLWELLGLSLAVFVVPGVFAVLFSIVMGE